MEKLKVLIIEDSLDDCDLLVRDLQKESWDVVYHRVDTREQMLDALKGPWDLILSDFSMPHFSGLQALEILKSTGKDIPFIMVSGTIGEEAAVDVMRAGASDYVLKTKTSRLMLAIRREVEGARQRARGLNAERALRDAEEQLRHIQKMEAVGQLAGGIAHDFNNMLSVVQIYCRKLKELNIPEVSHYVDKILDVHNRSASLTRQLLIFSRKQSTHPVLLDLGEVMAGMQDMLQSLLGKGVELRMETRPDISKIKADPGQMEQVLMNLAVNARDAMPQGGLLRFKISNVDFPIPTLVGGKSLQGNYVLLEASDTGFGISKDILHRIFEPFFTTKSAKNGTGLGLSIIYGIIHQSGGEITVSSQPRQGTTFKIYLPESREVAQRPMPSPKAPRTFHGQECLLLVEDNTELRELFAETLRSRGYQVLEAADGLAALALIDSSPKKIDLVITDIVMPKLSGRDLYDKAVRNHPNIRFIYMSGYFESSFAKNPAETFYFLQKPFSEEKLLEKIRSVLDKT